MAGSLGPGFRCLSLCGRTRTAARLLAPFRQLAGLSGIEGGWRLPLAPDEGERRRLVVGGIGIRALPDDAQGSASSGDHLETTPRIDSRAPP